MDNYFQKQSEAKKLLQSVQGITNFDAVATWDSNASDQIKILLESNIVLNNQLSDLNKQLIKAKNDYQSIPFFKRLFTSKFPIRTIENQISVSKSHISENTSLAEQLQEWIDKTPDDISQAKALLVELKQIKKELTILKKEISAAIRSTNQQARAKNSKIANQYFTNSKYKQIQRIGVRAEKESALRMHESEKEVVESQIIEVEKMILWIERIKNS